LQLDDPNSPFGRRRAGLLLHLTSLPSRHGVGDLGASAHAFCEFLAKTGQGLWQMLPTQPIGPGNSPYSASSAFANEPLLIDLVDLADRGWLSSADLKASATLSKGDVDFAAVRAFKQPRLEKAFEGFRAKGGPRTKAFQKYCAREAAWLEPWCAFSGGEPELHAFLQYAFDLQWRALRKRAKQLGVQLIGDLPIFVTLDSADVFARPELFRLDKQGKPEVVSGCPPDGFNPSGQRWGHPHYRWAVHKREKYAWWLSRFERQLELFDGLRVDHFIGFHHAWEVPGRASTAKNGKWGKSHGRAILEELVGRFGAAPLIAEDLGSVSQAVIRLRDDYDLPGMKVLQFAFYGDDSDHLPHRAPERSVVYSGTHDNDTTQGWWKSLKAAEKKRCLAYTGGSAATVHQDLIRLAWTSPARTAIAPVQDLLGLPRSARFNRPGTASGNWKWRLAPGALGATQARWLGQLTAASAR
jgi:4-alpha-glucanotransferase